MHFLFCLKIPKHKVYLSLEKCPVFVNIVMLFDFRYLQKHTAKLFDNEKSVNKRNCGSQGKYINVRAIWVERVISQQSIAITIVNTESSKELTLFYCNKDLSQFFLSYQAKFKPNHLSK